MRSHAEPRESWSLPAQVATLGAVGIIFLYPVPFGAMHGWALHLLRSLLVALALVCVAAQPAAPATASSPPATNRLWARLALAGIFCILMWHHVAGVVRSLTRTDSQKLGLWSTWAAASPALDCLIALVELMIFASLFILVFSPRRKRILLATHALILSGTFQAIYGLVQYFTGSNSILGVPNVRNRNVAFGTFVNPDHYSGYLEMILPVCIGYIIARSGKSHAPQPLKERILAFGHESFQKSILYVLAALIMALGIIFSGSRSGFIVLLTSLLLLALSGGPGRRLAHSKRWVTTLLVLLCLVGLWIGFDPVYGKLTRAASDHSLERRLEVWGTCLMIVRDYPLFGIGSGSLPRVYPQYEQHDLGYRTEYAHNAYIQAAVDFGLVGLALWLTLAATCTYTLHREWKARHHPFARGLGAGCLVGICAMYLHSMTDFLLAIPANQFTVVALYGLGYSVVRWRHENN